jgi:hypothetical protein
MSVYIYLECYFEDPSDFEARVILIHVEWVKVLVVVHLNDIKMEIMNCKRSIDILRRADYSIEAKETFFLG